MKKKKKFEINNQESDNIAINQLKMITFKLYLFIMQKKDWISF